MTQAVFFDIGNVLVFFDHGKMFEQIGAVCGLEYQEVEEDIKTHQLGILYETGLISTNQLCEYFEKKAKKTFSRDFLLKAIAEIFEPNPSIYPIVHALQSKGIPLFLLSNVSELHFQYLQIHFPILTTFEAPILSYEIQAMKPNPAIFQAALAKANCPAKECFYIDDIFEYVLAARELGIDAEQYLNTMDLIEQLKRRGLFIGT